MFAESSKDREKVSLDDIQQLINQLSGDQKDLSTQGNGPAQGIFSEGRDKCSEFFDFALKGYIALDSKGTVLAANNICTALLGVEKSDLINAPFSHFVMPEHEERYLSYFKNILNNITRRTCELKLKNGESGPLYSLIDSLLIRDEKSNTKQVRIVITDISELRRAQEALKKSEEQMALVLKGANLGVWEIDVQTGKFVCSPSWIEMLGYSLDEDFGLPSGIWNTLVHPEDLLAVGEFLNAYFHGQVPFFEAEYRFLSKFGEWRWILTCGKITERDEDGAIRRLAGTHLDITARKQAETALQELEKQLDSVLDNAIIQIWAFDGEKYFYFNKAYYNYTGQVSSSPFSLAMWFEVVHPDDLEESVNVWNEAYNNKRAYNHCMRLKRFDGKYRQFDCYAIPIFEEDGQFRHYQGYNADITERARMEKELENYTNHLEQLVEERTQELRDAQERLIRKEKLAMLGKFAGGMGHELRNPLSVISNAVYYLKASLSDADETTLKYLDIISSEVTRSAKIVSDVMAFSRCKSAEKREINVSNLISLVLANHPPPENVKVVVKTPSELPKIIVDPMQIEQVLANLIINACQAMPAGGVLTITVREESSNVCVSIADTGCGISLESMKHLFDPLFTTKVRGVGLGLALSRDIIESTGGSIEVESEEGRGSIFTVFFRPKPG